jgi:hypothetical protein
MEGMKATGAARLHFLLGLAALAAGVSSTAHAATDCEFKTFGHRMRLVADCATDQTIFVGDNMTLDGNGHVITAVDPPEGSFRGPVISNAGSVMHVRRLALDTGALAVVCHAEAPLSGILFRDASGSVIDSEIANIQQASGGCQEGAAIEARAADGSDAEIALIGNHVFGYQKTGIGLHGDVDARISFNHLEGYGATDRLAQNGIQVSFGATATIRWNVIESHVYAPQTAAATGILLWEAAPGCSIGLNTLRTNDVGVYILDSSGARVRHNRIEDATFVSIFEDGSSDDNVLERNQCSAAGAEVACVLP